ncbi:MAG: phosphoenolpyruvate--protein phosphotransferase [Phycisphaeraceae bacterium]
MFIKKGIPVSHGVAICQAVVLDAEDQPIPRRTVPAALTSIQHQRFKQALEASAAELQLDRDRVEKNPALGPDFAKIFDTHLFLLKDKHLIDQVTRMIDSERVTAEYAVYSVMRRQAQAMRDIDIPYFRERDRDIWDLERRLIGHLIGQSRKDLDRLTHDAIVIARDLTPSQTAALDKSKIKGIATEMGGSTSHTAILAKALKIPSVVGVGDITSTVSTGDLIIVDGNRGQVIINPDAAQQFNYRQEMTRISAFETALDEMASLPAETTDGVAIALHANIEFPEEIESSVEKGAVGIGLYRTEFLYLASTIDPTEEEHYKAYVQAIDALGGRMLTIRTLDLGADKLITSGLTPSMERNPFLGVRSIRLCLQNPPLFMTQLRAILRASPKGPVRIMFPLISNIMELRQAKMILNDVKEDLEREGIPFAPDIPVGIMVEVPSVAVEAAKFAKEVDFFSIGTNDLIQYTLAVDRGNERIASLYSAANPAVIQLIKDVIRAGARAKIDVSLCGEMAGELDFVMLLIGLGLRSLSITPPAIPEVKKLIRSVSVGQCKRLARKAMSFDSDREVLKYLRDETRKILPEAFGGH